MAENKRRRIHEQLEVVQTGFANGVAPGFPLNDQEKLDMIEQATKSYGEFLDALKCDWRNDPNSMETPHRVAKAYVNDLWAGRYDQMSPITSFPSDGYDGIIIERNVTIVGTHNCVSCRGVKHQGAAMVTTKASGVFRDNDNLARKEFFDSLKINNGGHNI